jgi:UDP-glucose 4-epimerase
MRVFVTGGAGFIGSHICEGLLAHGHSVHVLDDLSTGTLENIGHLRHHERFQYTIDTCHDARIVGELTDEADAVLHLAAAVGVELVVDSPVHTIETNVHGTEVILSQASRTQTPILLTSTSEVYGKSPDLPFREDGDIVLGATTRARWGYACSKAIDEFLAFAYAKERQLPVTVARLFNTAGPRQTGRYGMVIPKFVRAALSGRDLHVYGDGTQTRCFCHVADVVDALIALLEAERFEGEIFNIGATGEISVHELAARVLELVGGPSRIVSLSYAEAYGEDFEDMARRVPDIGRVRAAIGWQPRRSLTDILADVIEHERTVAPGAIESTTAPSA